MPIPTVPMVRVELGLFVQRAPLLVLDLVEPATRDAESAQAFARVVACMSLADCHLDWQISSQEIFVIGFLSGLIGIGGGIILSPVILLMGWGTMKQTAAVSALFILVNSISGISGFLLKGGVLPESSLPLIGIVFVGGFFGAYYGSKKFNSVVLKNVLALVLGIAIYKLYATAWL